MRIVTLACAFVVSLWCFTECHAGPGGGRPHGARPNPGSGKPSLDPSGGAGSQRPSDPGRAPGVSGPLTGPMAEGPFKAPSPKDKMDIFFDLYEEQQSQQVGARDPQKAWNQVVGALYLPDEYKWVSGNELEMEKKLTDYYQKIYAKPIEDLLKQRQNIVSQYSTSTGGIVYVIKTSDGFRLITKYPDGTYTMSGTFLFLSAQDYANYYRAYKKWLDSGAKGPFTYDVYDGSQLPSPLSGVIQIPIGQGSRPDDLTITPTGGNDPDELGDLGGYTITIRRPIPKPIYMMYEKR